MKGFACCRFWGSGGFTGDPYGIRKGFPRDSRGIPESILKDSEGFPGDSPGIPKGFLRDPQGTCRESPGTSRDLPGTSRNPQGPPEGSPEGPQRPPEARGIDSEHFWKNQFFRLFRPDPSGEVGALYGVIFIGMG